VVCLKKRSASTSATAALKTSVSTLVKDKRTARVIFARENLAENDIAIARFVDGRAIRS
jgi:hypothetical protein